MAIATGTAIAIAAGIAGLGTVYASNKAGEATQAQTQAVGQAQATTLKMYEQTRTDLAPWAESGQRGLAEYEKRVAAGPGEFDPSQDPGYKFGFEEGMKGINRQASALGQYGSGGTGKALARYASDYASTKYDQWLQRWQSSLMPYQNLSEQGRMAAGGQAQAATGAGQNLSQLAMQGGQVQAQGAANQANLWGGFAGQAGQGLLDYYYSGGGGTSGYSPGASGPGGNNTSMYGFRGVG